jgi:protoporphyrinogen oxidase
MSEEEPSSLSVAIIGAGPAGLTAAYYLLKSVHSDCEVTVLEVDPKYVGGSPKLLHTKASILI